MCACVRVCMRARARVCMRIFVHICVCCNERARTLHYIISTIHEKLSNLKQKTRTTIFYKIKRQTKRNHQ